ncbi:S-adenosyl-L-methionine-dependentmethyltransferases superfamily protein [Striga asiatica]|uniref:S-adenosyl-L-methionine-dependentmethyltransferases superfamily protein n=1 Tax=Striga asiatica TaxID=4170 RepID=A0A5A7PKY2_STRAF|nr:S-adenosyl-L-methionine-dependentmethyltransferases superfamily protein [Striga asiatica]
MFTILHSPQQWHYPSHQNSSKSPPSPSLPLIISSHQNSPANNRTAENTRRSSPAGKIKRLALTQQSRTKLNNNPDRDFYEYPRFVTHVDKNFILNLTDLYRETLRPEMEILDLMSSWVSHLPVEVEYRKVVGHGLNAQELARNPRLNYFLVKDLNKEQEFEMEGDCFDAVLCTVSVQYLQQPEKSKKRAHFNWSKKRVDFNWVFAEIFRILRPGGVFIVSFSNRLFYEKAVSAWRDGTAYSRVQLVVEYFQCIEGFTQPQVIRKLPHTNGDESSSIFGRIKGLLGLLTGSDPFYAVIAYKNFKPVYE